MVYDQLRTSDFVIYLVQIINGNRANEAKFANLVLAMKQVCWTCEELSSRGDCDDLFGAVRQGLFRIQTTLGNTSWRDLVNANEINTMKVHGALLALLDRICERAKIQNGVLST